MQIKEFYLDLREWPQYGKKERNVWLLESEAFKEPLKFKFTFDSEDLEKLQKIENSCRDYYDLVLRKEKAFNDIVDWIYLKQKEIEDKLKQLELIYQKMDEISNKLIEKEKTLKKKDLEENNKLIEILEKVNNIRKEIDLPKPSKIYSKQWEEFISWDDTYYWSKYDIAPWEYYIIEKFEYEPQNEYVMNKDEVKISKVYIEDWFVPEIQLLWSNAIDKPVAKVKLYVLFFKI